MALLKTFTYKGIQCPNGYHRISGFFSIGKTKVNVIVNSYLDQETRTLNEENYLEQKIIEELDFDTNSDTKFLQLMYDELKQEAFLGATDI